MSTFAAPLDRARALPPRSAALLAAAVLGVAALALALRLSPPSALPAAFGIGAVALASALTLALLTEPASLTTLAKLFGAAAIPLGGAALTGAKGDSLSPAFGLLSLTLAAALAWRLAPRIALPARSALGIAATLAAALCVYNLWYVTASRDLEIADFMYYRLVSVAVASLIDTGRLPALILDVAASMKADYSWAPSLLPGAALALGAPLSRAVYQGAIVLAYAVPALLSLGWLACRIAGVRGAVASLFALAAVAAAYPAGVTVAARGMPDIGGLALFVLALALAEKLPRALTLPPGHEARVRAAVVKIALGLALTLFAMFLFRRWYAFAATGICAALGLELAFRLRALRWRDAAVAAACGALVLLALVSPVLVDWLPNPAAHDYAAMYAAYRKPPEVLLSLIGDWYGFGILAAAIAGGALCLVVSPRARLARLAFVSGLVAAALFLRVQSPYVHHVYLIAPAVMVAIAAPLLRLFARSRVAGLAALAVLAAATLTPAAALAPKGWLPTYAYPHAPRTDLAELQRLRAWVDAHAKPDAKVCGLGSSYTFSGQLIDELWQLAPARSPLHGDPSLRTSVAMSDVDTVEGAPNPAIKDCAFLIVGDPVQTHLLPAYQQTVIVPSREMLTGEGIGSHYRRTGEAFTLEKGVTAVVFERTAPLDDADMEALAARWRAARR